jgi:hypothetical protein
MKNLGQNSWSRGRDLIPALPEYEAGVLTTQPCLFTVPDTCSDFGNIFLFI